MKQYCGASSRYTVCFMKLYCDRQRNTSIRCVSWNCTVEIVSRYTVCFMKLYCELTLVLLRNIFRLYYCFFLFHSYLYIYVINRINCINCLFFFKDNLYVQSFFALYEYLYNYTDMYAQFSLIFLWRTYILVNTNVTNVYYGEIFTVYLLWCMHVKTVNAIKRTINPCTLIQASPWFAYVSRGTIQLLLYLGAWLLLEFVLCTSGGGGGGVIKKEIFF